MQLPRPDTALYFGTFNPIHTGHLMIAQAVSGQFGLRGVTFIPAGNPPHRARENDLLAARHRFRMVQLATAANPAFHVSDLELRRSGKSYTIDSIRDLLGQNLARMPVPIIIGSDALAGLPGWREPRALAEAVRFLQAPRPDYPFISAVEIEGVPVTLNTCPIEMPPLAISSTWARMLASQGAFENLRYYLPEPVRRYIQDNRLYRG